MNGSFWAGVCIGVAGAFGISFAAAMTLGALIRTADIAEPRTWTGDDILNADFDDPDTWGPVDDNELLRLARDINGEA